MPYFSRMKSTKILCWIEGMSLYPNPTDGIHAVLSRIKFSLKWRIKNRHISLDRLYEVNPDILVDLNWFDLRKC